MISGSTGPIFTKFSPNGRYLIVDYQCNLHFLTAQGPLPRQPISESKLAKSDYSPLFVAMAFRNRLQYRHSDFNKFICDDLAILLVNLVNFGKVTPEFNRVVGVHPPDYNFFETNYVRIYMIDFHLIFTV